MRNVSFSSLVVRNVADAATSPAPVAPAATPAPATTEAKPVRVLKQRSAKPASKPANKPEAKQPVKLAKPGKPATEAAKPSANVTRTAATIAAGACNFGGLSDRDNAYMRFYAGLAKRATGGVVTLRGIVESGHARVPGYTGSGKPHDAGVIQRLAKAGILAIRDNGAAFTFTAKAKTHAAYAQA